MRPQNIRSVFVKMGESPVFKYTVSNKGLTTEQRQFYEENGFIMFRNLISHDDLDKYCSRFVDICNGKVDKSGYTVVRDYALLTEDKVGGEHLLYKIQDFLYDPVFFEYSRDKKILDVVSSIIGEGVTAVNSMLINKPPNSITSGHPLHQDLHFFPFRPAYKICASWTAMERMDEENGCLMAIPGSHRWELYPHCYPKPPHNSVYHGVVGFDHFPKVKFLMEKGDTLFFHPLLLHGSDSNKSQGFRKTISVHYVSNDCHFINLQGTSQQWMVEEVEDIFRIKSCGVTYRDSWRVKSRRITGSPGEFHKLPARL